MVTWIFGEGAGRFLRTNLHCHSTRSDGHAAPEAVIAAYRGASYHTLAVSDHYEAEYGWAITDPRGFRAGEISLLVGAELSSGDWDALGTFWVTATGLPADFPPPGKSEDVGAAIRRAHAAGAYITLLHPGLNNISPEVLVGHPALDAIDAVEIYNHNVAMGGGPPDRAYAGAFLDTLLDRGHRLHVNAGDDAHFGHPADRFGGWLEVWADCNESDAVLASLKAGRFFATQGPRITRLGIEGEVLHVETSPAYAISLTGSGSRWRAGSEQFAHGDAPVTTAAFDLTPFRGSWCRVTVVDRDGRYAWSNPIWP